MIDRPESWVAGDWTARDRGSSETHLTTSFVASRLTIGGEGVPLSVRASPRDDALSCRMMAPRPLGLSDRDALLSVLCGDGSDIGPYPSAGRLYPCQPFLVEQDVDSEAKACVSYLDGAAGSCRKIGQVDCARLCEVLFEDWAWPTGCLIVLVVDFTRVMHRYGDRGLRFGLLESGLLMSRILRSAKALNLCACAVGGFDDVELVRVLRLDPRWYGAAVAVSIGYHAGNTELP